MRPSARGTNIGLDIVLTPTPNVQLSISIEPIGPRKWNLEIISERQAMSARWRGSPNWWLTLKSTGAVRTGIRFRSIAGPGTSGF